MGLKKEITSSNGVVTTYHRIAMVKIETNQQNTILVLSYINEQGRQVEKDYENGLYNNFEEGIMNFPYVNSRYININYISDMSVSGAYDYLKTLPEFEGATDV